MSTEYVNFIKKFLTERVEEYPYLVNFKAEDMASSRTFTKFIDHVTETELIFLNRYLPEDLKAKFPEGLQSKEDVIRFFSAFIVKILIKYEYNIYSTEGKEIEFNELISSNVVFEYLVDPQNTDELKNEEWIANEIPVAMLDFFMEIRELKIGDSDLINYHRKQA